MGLLSVATLLVCLTKLYRDHYSYSECRVSNYYYIPQVESLQRWCVHTQLQHEVGSKGHSPGC